MKAIVGLGNPGREYAGTRHNIGFDVVEEVARRWNVQLRPWKSVADVAVVGARGAVLVEPQTFMNLSGDAVSRIAAFHKLEPADVLVVVDEVQLPVGRVRVRRSGSSGGHNGLKSIIQHIGDGFPRLRIGVDRGDPKWNLADHVLSRFSRDERDLVADAVSRAADAVELFVEEGVEAVMNRFNADSSKSSE
jgi:PTH1 family peptidyl-tRNA hydrolase